MSSVISEKTGSITVVIIFISWQQQSVKLNFLLT